HSAPVKTERNPEMNRRQFARLVGFASTLGLIEPQTIISVLADGKRQIGYLANRTAGAEGAWELKRIEGKVPKDLNGTLYRVAPGQKEIFGVRLQHLFDGDAFVSRYSFREGKVSLRARFVETPQRLEEIKAGRMLYGEFGTPAPPLPEGYKPAHGGKNQPSVNVIRWDGPLLALSEGGHPTAIDPNDLSYQGEWDFYGTLPNDMSFTAHPKFDPQTGEGYAYGIRKGPGMALTGWRMGRNGKLAQLHALPQKGFFMIHDMLLAREHLVFVIPPVRYEVGQLISGKVTPADAVRYFENEPMRLVILRRDGTGTPVTIEQPAGMVFHHGNAFEHDGKLIIDSILSPDGSVLEALHAFSQDRLPATSPNKLTRLILDPAKATIESRTEMEAEQEFPRFDARRGGAEARYLYTAA